MSSDTSGEVRGDFWKRAYEAASERADLAEKELRAARELYSREYVPGVAWRDPKDKPAHLPGEHHSEDVLLCMKPRGWVDGDDHGIRIGHVSCGNWRPRGANGNFDDDVLGWMPLPARLISGSEEKT